MPKYVVKEAGVGKQGSGRRIEKCMRYFIKGASAGKREPDNNMHTKDLGVHYNCEVCIWQKRGLL